jgi:hypothetical protein
VEAIFGESKQLSVESLEFAVSNWEMDLSEVITDS